MVESNGKDIYQASFEYGGYASYFEHTRTLESAKYEGSSRFIFSVFNSKVIFGEVRLEARMKFINLEDFKNVVKDVHIDIRREIMSKKNDNVRVRIIYCYDECPCVSLCSWNSSSCTYYIKTLNLEHTCCRVFRNKSTSRDWIANKLK